MAQKLRIAVTGLAATYPFGGVFWDYVQYPLGLARLGHEVLYIEDTGQWCYDPGQQTFVEGGAQNAALLARSFAQLAPELTGRWFYRDAAGQCFGATWEQVGDYCRRADLFLHLSATCWMREEYFGARRVVFIDSDPMYTQASVPAYVDGTSDAQARARLEVIRRHQAFFSFGENIGRQDCRVPGELFAWQPTRQPVVLDRFAGHLVPVERRRRVFTTVASWEPAQDGPLVRGVQYRGKSVEFERFLDLPRHSQVPLELAMSGRAPKERLREHGWVMVDPGTVSGDAVSYRDYLAHSLGEWSVAKNAYVAGHTGWFSCRTACYLALGVPAVVQDTGFSRFLPTGEGLIAFGTLEEAAAGLAAVAAEPRKHAQAARALAQEYFDSDKVLGRLIEAALG